MFHKILNTIFLLLKKQTILQTKFNLQNKTKRKIHN